MNNFKESLPKTGHVNEVCKEWLVREDGALAYKLQSQEINDFYKGNRFRNAVVREDFPTALHEQIKERETADRQTEVYRRRMMAQEQHDKRVAKEIADKLERDLREQQQKDFNISEEIAQRMQEIYVNMPPVPPPNSRDKSQLPPPRPAKASSLLQQPSPLFASSSQHHHHHQQQQQHPNQTQHTSKQQQQPQIQIQLQQQHFSDTNGYVGLSLDAPTTPQRPRTHSHNSSGILVSDESPLQQQQQQQHRHQPPQQQHNRHHRIATATVSSTSPSPSSVAAAAYTSSSSSSSNGLSMVSSSSASVIRRNLFEPTNNINHPSSTTSSSSTTTTTSSSASQSSMSANQHQPNPCPVLPNNILPTVDDDAIEYADVIDSIRRYDITSPTNHQPPHPSSSVDPHRHHHLRPPSPLHQTKRAASVSHENLLRFDKNFQKLSPEKYDELVGNSGGAGGVGAAALAARERAMQAHADDIDLYVDPCDYASLQEIGLPMHELKEMSKKLKQEQKDELLARRLQEMESKEDRGQEHRDRLMAIEAQDKELAKMLQEREKVKAKRAKEKARLRKSQQKEAAAAASAAGSPSSPGTTMCSPLTNGSFHCGPLLSLPQDCLSGSKHSASSSPSASLNNRSSRGMMLETSEQQLQQQQLPPPLDMEAYSNPIDVIHQSQRTVNGPLTNGSLTRTEMPASSASLVAARRVASGNLQRGDDDIYTLPVDSCRATATAVATASRSLSVDLAVPENGPAVQYNSMTRSENYSLHSHDSGGHSNDTSARMNYSKSSSFDQSSSPTPPYMPIQGTRRSNSSEDRKKRSKDKCTHQ